MMKASAATQATRVQAWERDVLTLRNILETFSVSHDCGWDLVITGSCAVMDAACGFCEVTR